MDNWDWAVSPVDFSDLNFSDEDSSSPDELNQYLIRELADGIPDIMDVQLQPFVAEGPPIESAEVRVPIPAVILPDDDVQEEMEVETTSSESSFEPDDFYHLTLIPHRRAMHFDDDGMGVQQTRVSANALAGLLNDHSYGELISSTDQTHLLPLMEPVPAVPQELVYHSMVQVAAGVSSFIDCEYDPFSPPHSDEGLLGDLFGDIANVKPESPASPASGDIMHKAVKEFLSDDDTSDGKTFVSIKSENNTDPPPPPPPAVVTAGARQRNRRGTGRRPRNQLVQRQAVRDSRARTAVRRRQEEIQVAEREQRVELLNSMIEQLDPGHTRSYFTPELVPAEFQDRTHAPRNKRKKAKSSAEALARERESERLAQSRRFRRQQIADRNRVNLLLFLHDLILQLEERLQQLMLQNGS